MLVTRFIGVLIIIFSEGFFGTSVYNNHYENDSEKQNKATRITQVASLMTNDIVERLIVWGENYSTNQRLTADI